jgi:hypothetical protein
MIATLLTCAALLVPVQRGDETDLLVLTDGKEVDCRVLYEDDEIVIARSRRKNREYPRADVAELHSVERSLRTFLERFDQVSKTDVGGLSDLALFCESQELPGEARNLWIRILLLDPVNEQAWTKLGGTNGRKGWRMKVRGRYYTLDELRERVSDWKNAMELRTAHFLLKTDTDPTRALDVAIDLERAYLTFYDVLGPPLKLYAFDELPEIHLYSNPDDYPKPPVRGDDSWFALFANTLYVNGAEGANKNQIVATFTDCLVYNSFRRTLGKQGSLTAWARKGLGVSFGAAVRGERGETYWDFDPPILDYFRYQANDDQPLELKQILRAGNASFDSGTHAQRYVAQAYTLTHFLVFAEEGEYRAGFADFLRSSFQGQGSTTHFEKALGVDVKDLEPVWIAYVKGVAGQ